MEINHWAGAAEWYEDWFKHCGRSERLEWMIQITLKGLKRSAAIMRSYSDRYSPERIVDMQGAIDYLESKLQTVAS